MASSLGDFSQVRKELVHMEKEEKEEVEEQEEDLFEIDLEVVNNLSPPHYWDSNSTATNHALLANCLLPISDISGAVPMVSKSRTCEALPPPSGVVFAEPVKGKFLGYPSMDPLSLILS
ncbi:unnamed protein product [Thlaspi arvense]|uniref:Uncharacterized protein n=1 Tax=Thlaspi arvense TaxID=13288 RepID=A0AAU9SFB7_THLAR|nr:unnamed protein product [Thlaspi arvense]